MWGQATLLLCNLFPLSLTYLCREKCKHVNVSPFNCSHVINRPIIKLNELNWIKFVELKTSNGKQYWGIHWQVVFNILYVKSEQLFWVQLSIWGRVDLGLSNGLSSFGHYHFLISATHTIQLLIVLYRIGKNEKHHFYNFSLKAYCLWSSYNPFPL